VDCSSDTGRNIEEIGSQNGVHEGFQDGVQTSDVIVVEHEEDLQLLAPSSSTQIRLVTTLESVPGESTSVPASPPASPVPPCHD
jgi:hypothetical protein